MNYIVSYEKISKYTAGMTVCFDTVGINPDVVGILHKIPSSDRERNGYWMAVINGVEHTFNANGVSIEPVSGIQLYAPKYKKIEYVDKASITRSEGGNSTVADTVSIISLQAKDQFALAAMQSILSNIKDPLSINDGTIAVISAKSYKIAEAMILQATEARNNNVKVNTEVSVDNSTQYSNSNS